MEEEKKQVPNYKAKKTKLGIEISNLDDTVIQPTESKLNMTEVVTSTAANQPSNVNLKIKHPRKHSGNSSASSVKNNDADELFEEVLMSKEDSFGDKISQETKKAANNSKASAKQFEATSNYDKEKT